MTRQVAEKVTASPYPAKFLRRYSRDDDAPADPCNCREGLDVVGRALEVAAGSPIVKESSENQFCGGAGLSYEFDFSLD